VSAHLGGGVGGTGVYVRISVEVSVGGSGIGVITEVLAGT